MQIHRTPRYLDEVGVPSRESKAREASRGELGVLEVLNNPVVKSATSLIVLPIILTIILIVVVLFLERLTRASPAIIEKERWKYWRYDAANPSKDKDVRKKVSMQYLGYLIIFLAVEPAIILIALLTAAPQAMLGTLLKLYAVFLVFYFPLLAYAISEARKVRAWMMD